MPRGQAINLALTATNGHSSVAKPSTTVRATDDTILKRLAERWTVRGRTAYATGSGPAPATGHELRGESSDVSMRSTEVEPGNIAAATPPGVNGSTAESISAT